MKGQSGLPLHAQKAVIGRILALQVLAPQLSRLESPTCQGAGRWLIECLYRYTNDALYDVENNESLAAFLGGLAAELEAEASKLRLEARDSARDMLRELRELIEAFCNSPHDPLAQLALAVAEAAASYYHAYSDAVPPELWRRTDQVVSFAGGPVSLSFAPGVYCQVETRFGTRDTHSAEVLLQIAPVRLDAATIAALPRALLHEYVSHVPQGPHHEARAHPDADDGFAEGWMDYVAHRIHRMVLERRGPENALVDQLPSAWVGLYQDAAERFFDARCALRDYDPVAAARREGTEAARQLHVLLGRLLRSADLSDEAFFRLSFGLNASDLSSPRRRRLTAVIRLRLLRASQADGLVPVLRLWIAGEIKLEDLIANLLG